MATKFVVLVICIIQCQILKLGMPVGAQALRISSSDLYATLSRTVKLQGSTRATTFHLKGLVYHGSFHFTCWIRYESGNIGLHDGMTTGRITIKEGRFGSVSQPDLKWCGNKQLCLVIYGHKSWMIQKTLNWFIPPCFSILYELLYTKQGWGRVSAVWSISPLPASSPHPN